MEMIHLQGTKKSTITIVLNNMVQKSGPSPNLVLKILRKLKYKTQLKGKSNNNIINTKAFLKS
jgi:hypothetical protein